MLSGLPLVHAVVLPCVVLALVSQFAAATAGHIIVAGMVRVPWLPVFPWVLPQAQRRHRREPSDRVDRRGRHVDRTHWQDRR